jgi:hypothetical protein
MADDFLGLSADSTGKKVDCSRLTVGSNTVYRQRVVRASPSNPAGLAEVVNAAPTTQYGLVTWGHYRFAKPTLLNEVTQNLFQSVGASGDAFIVFGLPGQVIRLYSLILEVTGSVQIVIKDGASISLTGGMQLSTNSKIVLPFDGEPWFVTSPGNHLNVNLSAPVTMIGMVYFTQS